MPDDPPELLKDLSELKTSLPVKGTYEGISTDEASAKLEGVKSLRNFLHDKKAKQKIKKLPGLPTSWKKDTELIENAKTALGLLVRLTQEEVEGREDEKAEALKIMDEIMSGGETARAIESVKKIMSDVEDLDSQTLEGVKDLSDKSEIEKLSKKLEEANVAIAKKLDETLEDEDKVFLEEAQQTIGVLHGYLQSPTGKTLTPEQTKFWKEEIRPKTSKLNKLIKKTPTPPAPPSPDKKNPDDALKALNGDWEKLNPEIKKDKIYQASRDVIAFFDKLEGEYKLKDEELASLQKTIRTLDNMALSKNQKQPFDPEDEKFWSEEIDNDTSAIRSLLLRKLKEKDELMTVEENVLKRLDELKATPEAIEKERISIQNARDNRALNLSEQEREKLNDVQHSFYTIEGALQGLKGDILTQEDLNNWEAYTKGEGVAELLRRDKKKRSNEGRDVQPSGREIKELVDEIGVRNILRIFRKLDKLRGSRKMDMLSPIIEDTTALHNAFGRLRLISNLGEEEMGKSNFSARDLDIISGFFKFYGGVEGVISSLDKNGEDDKAKEESSQRYDELVKKYTLEALQNKYEELKQYREQHKDIFNPENDDKSMYFLFEAFERFFSYSAHKDQYYLDGFDVNRISNLMNNPDILTGVKKPEPEPDNEDLTKSLSSKEALEWVLAHLDKATGELKEFLDECLVLLRKIEAQIKDDGKMGLEEMNEYHEKISGGKLQSTVKRLREEQTGGAKPPPLPKPKPGAVPPPLPKIENGSDLWSKADKDLIDRKLREIGLKSSDLEALEEFNLIKNDPGKVLFVINNMQQVKLKYIQEEGERAHAHDLNFKSGFWKKRRLNFFKKSNILRHETAIAEKGMDADYFEDEMRNLMLIADAGPALKIENGDLVGQYLDKDFIEKNNLKPEDAERFNRAASAFANQSTELDTKKLSFWDRRARAKAQSRYENESEKMLKQLAKQRGLEFYSKKDGMNILDEDGNPVINPEVQSMMDMNLIDLKVISHQSNIQHPEVERELRNFQSGKYRIAVGAGAFVAGMGGLAVSGGRWLARYKALSILGSPAALAVSVGLGAIVGGVGGDIRGRRTAKNELIKRDMERRQGLRKDSEGKLDKHFVKVGSAHEDDKNSLIGKLSSLEKELRGLLNESGGKKEEVAKRNDRIATLTRALESRVYYTQKKLADEAVIFGDEKSSLVNRFNLIKAMSAAQVAYKFGETKMQEHGIARSDHSPLTRLDRFMRYNAIQLDKNRRKYTRKEIDESRAMGMAMGAGLGLAGNYVGRNAGKWGGWVLNNTEFGHAIMDGAQNFSQFAHDYLPGFGLEHGVDAQNHLARNVAAKIHEEAIRLNTHNNLSMLADTPSVPAHESISATEHFTLQNEGQSREYAIARILQKEYMAGHPGANAHEALRHAQKEAYDIVRNKEWDLGNKAEGIHHGSHDREWRDFKVVHEGDTVVMDKAHHTIRVIPKGQPIPTSAPEAATPSTVSTPQHAPESIAVPPQQPAFDPEQKLKEAILHNAKDYGYQGNLNDGEAIKRYADMVDHKVFSDPETMKELKNVLKGDHDYLFVNPNNGGFDVIVKHGPDPDHAKEILHKFIAPDSYDGTTVKNLVMKEPPQLDQNGNPLANKNFKDGVLPKWYYPEDHGPIVGQSVHTPSTPVGPTVEVPHSVLPSREILHKLASSLQLGDSTVEKLAQLTPRADMNIIDQYKGIFFKDPRFLALSSENNRNVAFLRIMKHVAGLNKEVIKTSGLGSGNIWDVPAGTSFDSTQFMDKSFFDDAFKLDNVTSEEVGQAKIFSQNSSSILEKLKDLSHKQPITTDKFMGVVRTEVLRKGLGL